MALNFRTGHVDIFVWFDPKAVAGAGLVLGAGWNSSSIPNDLVGARGTDRLPGWLPSASLHLYSKK